MERAPETARKSTTSIPLHSMPGTGSSSAAEENESGVHLCEVCGTCFETKRGLSSHCRSHLRQLGVAVSDSSGAPIDLLYELIRERDGKLPYPSPKASSDKTPTHKPPRKPKIPKSLLTPSLKTIQTPTHKTPKAPTPKTPQSSTLKTPSPKKDSTTKLKIKIASLVKKYSKSPSAGSAPLSPGPSPPQLSPIKPDKPRKVPTEPKSVPGPVSPPLSPSLSLASSKPMWAPQETDAPLNLTAMTDPSLRDDVHVCELCGAWYETRKGLSSHARAHLRQFGVEIDSKGAPIDILHELLLKEEQSGRVSPLQLDDNPPSSTPPRAAPKRPTPSSPLPEGPHTAPVSPPPLKKIKISAAAVGAEPEEEAFGLKAQRKGDSSKDVSCEFCHEKFKKSQSLASHARSHLRQLGITEWTVHGSPMATLRDLMARRGTTSLPKPHAPPSKHSATPMKPLSSPIKPHAPPTKDSATPTKPHTSPTKPYTPPGQSRVLEKPVATPTKPLALPTKPHDLPPKPLPSTPTSPLPPSTALPPLTPGSAPIAPGSAPPRVPKARKGSRTVVPKPKDEPVEKNITVVEPPKPKNTTTPSLTAPVSSSSQSSTVLKPEADLSMPVRCDYCSEMFDSRKALSCHARAHLRQLGVRWSPNASPIDTLYELMLREGTLQGSEVKPEPAAGASGLWRKATSSPRTFTTSPVDFFAEKTDSLDNMAAGCEATCDLCGFDFENRKALASHARAHLRQQGVDWHTNGSPIETLAEWMQREPGKVAELHKRYMRGELPQVVKKRSSTSPHPSLSDPEPARPATAREVKGQPSTSSAHRKPLASQHTPTHTAARGCERRPPKHIPHSDSRLGAGPLKPRVGNAPSLMPRPPESSLVKLVGKVYSLKCRFCEEVFKGPLSVQEDWLIHLRQHILNLKRDSAPNSAPITQSPAPTIQHSDTAQLIGPQVI
ncbi:protein Wiz isoform X2 [Colossoma macropomum]|uniref:protein Wiz isoform X2 n=1 Tax=Colossoma macropomum TaxID=42526 RepID=UPI001863B2E1|nr:protein Wiz isoform X2 [Colossoma macropomum]